MLFASLYLIAVVALSYLYHIARQIVRGEVGRAFSDVARVEAVHPGGSYTNSHTSLATFFASWWL